MTFQEFEAVLKEDAALRQRFLEAKEAVSAEPVKDKALALSGIIRDLGYDIPADEIALQLIGLQSMDEKELETVAGGLNQYSPYHTCNKNEKTGESSRAYSCPVNPF